MYSFSVESAKFDNVREAFLYADRRNAPVYVVLESTGSMFRVLRP